MPTNFEIRIVGVSLCYYKPPYWIVIFPCDENHPVRLCYEGREQKLHAKGAFNVVEFPIAAIPHSSSQYRDVTIEPFNMSREYAHGKTTDSSGAEHSNLRFKSDFRKNPSRDFVMLRIPNASLSTATPAPCKYFVQDVTGAPGISMEILEFPIARDVIFDFVATRPFDLEARDDRTNTVRPIGTFPDNSGSGSIRIDNDCYDDCPVDNDFRYFYWMAEDVNAGGVVRLKLAAGQTKCPELQRQRVPCGSGSGTAKMVPQYGNCDPVIVDPPPPNDP